MNQLENFFSKNNSAELYAKEYINYLSDVFAQISLEDISKFINKLIDARNKSSTVYFIGNGGSAATASHFANDLAIGTRSHNLPLKAVSLCDNNAILTAIANDYGYDQIFQKQLEVILKPEDLVVAISASGNSTNLINAINFANSRQVCTIGLTSFDGGKLKKISNLSVHIPALKGEYGPAEDGHMMLDHLVGSYLTYFFKASDNS